jgi:hypothetical protein
MRAARRSRRGRGGLCSPGGSASRRPRRSTGWHGRLTMTRRLRGECLEDRRLLSGGSLAGLVWHDLDGNGKDAFVARFTSEGNLVWAGNIGGAGTDEGRGVAVDAGGNAYVVGMFQQTADVDPGRGTFNLTAEGYTAGFLCKLNPAGSLAWARQGYVDGAVAVGPRNQVYCIGLAPYADFSVTSPNGDLLASGMYLRSQTGDPFCWPSGCRP